MDIPDCNSKDCSFCSQLRKQDYLKTGAEARTRLEKLVSERLARPLKRDIITQVFDSEYQEWIDNNLSLEGRS